jgi:hypothetical protein
MVGMAMMTVQEVFEGLHQLSAEDKFRAVQLLLRDLAVEEESLLKHGGEYELWSQYDSADAAARLLQIMREEEQKLNG